MANYKNECIKDYSKTLLRSSKTNKSASKLATIMCNGGNIKERVNLVKELLLSVIFVDVLVDHDRKLEYAVTDIVDALLLNDVPRKKKEKAPLPFFDDIWSRKPRFFKYIF